ncbi:DUF4113 domain-containing protein [Morganella morganii subsp. sibonii]
MYGVRFAGLKYNIKREMLTPAYTTNSSQLPVVKS